MPTEVRLTFCVFNLKEKVFFLDIQIKRAQVKKAHTQNVIVTIVRYKSIDQNIYCTVNV